MTTLSSSAPALILQKEGSAGADGLSDSSAVSSVVVHPLVLLSVLDHHTRRQEGQLRVIGTLLGRRDGDKVRPFCILETTVSYSIVPVFLGANSSICIHWTQTQMQTHTGGSHKLLRCTTRRTGK